MTVMIISALALTLVQLWLLPASFNLGNLQVPAFKPGQPAAPDGPATAHHPGRRQPAGKPSRFPGSVPAGDDPAGRPQPGGTGLAGTAGDLYTLLPVRYYLPALSGVGRLAGMPCIHGCPTGLTRYRPPPEVGGGGFPPPPPPYHLLINTDQGTYRALYSVGYTRSHRKIILTTGRYCMLDTVSFFFNRCRGPPGAERATALHSADPQPRSPGRNRHRKR